MFSRSYNFQRHVRTMSRAICFELIDVEPEIAIFHIPYDGSNYYVAIKDIPEGYLFSSMSNFVFPQGRCPSVICNTLSNINEESDGLVWDIATVKTGQKFALRRVLRQNIDAGIVTEIINQLVSNVVGLDRLMQKRGLV